MIKIKKVYHSCFVIDVDGYKIVTDPYVETDTQIEEINKANLVLISHGHFDHISALKHINNEAKIISNFELCLLVEGLGYQTLPMNFGGEIEIKNEINTIKIGLVKAEHTSSLNVQEDIIYAGNAGGFIIKINDKTLYFMGDTDIFGDMKILCDLYKPNVIMMPIGDTYTMGIDKALFAIDNLLTADFVIPMHYNIVEEKQSSTDITTQDLEDFIKKSKIKVKVIENLQEIEL